MQKREKEEKLEDKNSNQLSHSHKD